MSILLPAILLAIAVVFFVLYPVVMGVDAPTGPEDEELTESQHRRRIALLALRDVEYDFHAGKLDEADYLAMKGDLASEALAAIDAEEAEWEGQGEARGERHPAARGDSGAGEGLEGEIAALRASIREGMVCSHCGHPNPRGSRFCGDCGAALATLRSAGGS